MYTFRLHVITVRAPFGDCRLSTAVAGVTVLSRRKEGERRRFSRGAKKKNIDFIFFYESPFLNKRSSVHH